jgi:hypothetical protein
MNKNTIWACAIINMISVSCWTLLAILFNRWWIALFALLFFVLPGTIKKYYYRICDGCGKRSEYANNYNEALDKAKAAGWVHYVDGNKDYCPECKIWNCKR